MPWARLTRCWGEEGGAQGGAILTNRTRPPFTYLTLPNLTTVKSVDGASGQNYLFQKSAESNTPSNQTVLDLQSRLLLTLGYPTP